MPYLNHDGVGIYYEVHGKGTPLLLSHGFSASSEMWRDQIAPLSANYKVITWDMRGHGRSGYPSEQRLYSEASTVGDMHALLMHICGDERAIVGGLSLGGYMSLAYYKSHPERCKALLIIDTGPGFKKQEARAAWNKTAHKTAREFEKFGLDAPYLKGASRERRWATHRNARGLALAARGMLRQRNNSELIDSLPRIKVPSLVVVGEKDEPFLAASEYMTKKIPGAQKVVVPKAGHAVNIDNPQGFLDGVTPFLEKVGGQRAML